MVVDPHTRKRQFQPSHQTTLTSYFTGQPCATYASTSASTSRSRAPLPPPLDPEIQASLLSVGMRVRKSIPEGYKTPKTVSLPEGPPRTTASSAPILDSTSSRPRELTPFCGIDKTDTCGLHRIGGWAAQQLPGLSTPAAMRRPASDGSDPPSTVVSSTCFAGSKKRGYEEDVEDDTDGFWEESIGARPWLGSATGRSVGRRKCSVGRAACDVVKMVDGDDFEEATFLVPMEVEEV